MTQYNAEQAARWFNNNNTKSVEMGLAIVSSDKMRTAYFPKNQGVMKMFPTPFGLRMMDAKLVSGVDEGNKLCVSLDTEQYEFYNTMQEQIMKTVIPQMKAMFPSWNESVRFDSVRVSEKSDKPYIKTKVQLNGASRTMGSDSKGVDVLNHAEALKTPGTVVNVKIGINGVFLTPTKFGLITSISMYNVKSVPDEEEIAAEKESIREEFEEFRKEALRNF